MRITMQRAALLSVLLCGAAAAQPLGERVGEQIGDHIMRYYPSAAAAKAAEPSMALLPGVAPRQAAGGARTTPTFGFGDRVQTARVDVEPGTSLYGTGEVSGPLLRNGRVVQMWNTDAYGYADPAPSLYESYPWVLAVRPDGTAFGVLADTTWRTTIDLTGGIKFAAAGPAFGIVVIERDTPLAVVQALADLTGHIEMPPLWAIGYHQCRYSYYPDSRVREIAAEFRTRKIPCDVIWMDIDYMRGYRCFTFDPKTFPDPAKLNADLHAQGFHSVWMIDPGIKAEPGYSVYDSGTAIDAWVKQADGSTYQGKVWPGPCVFPDFTMQPVRQWWSGLYKDYIATGIDGVWNDMNEPAVFDVKSKTMPEDNLHRGDAGIGGAGTHSKYHNVYGRLMVEATREGVMAANPQKRPFVLSRANFIGGQRFAAMWTGDNTADWSHMEESVPMTLNMGLSGQPFAGPDIGGFAGNGPEGKEGALFARWMGVGALLPFSRGHTGKENIQKEPWAFGPQVEATCRRALERRYRMLPYFYTLFHEAADKGSPVVRPVFFADAKDPALRSEDDAFLLGADVLVVPQMVPDRTRAPVMPKGLWRQFGFDDTRDADLPKLYARGGAIVPAGPVMQYAGEKPLEEITLVVCLDEAGKASGTLYEDAGEGWGFKTGEYRLTTFAAEKNGQQVSVKVAKVEGSMPGLDRKIAARILMPAMEVIANGTEKSGAAAMVVEPVVRPGR